MRELHIERIEKLGLKKKHLAAQINVDQATLSRWLHMKGNLSPQKIERLEEILF